MCNYLHSDSKPIPKHGYGYKIFARRKFGRDKQPRSMYTNDTYIYGPGGWIIFNPDINKSITWSLTDKGFCFFLDLYTARNVLSKWQYGFSEDIYEYYIAKIEYDNGMGTHVDNGFLSHEGVPIALCRDFYIIEELTGELENV